MMKLPRALFATFVAASMSLSPILTRVAAADPDKDESGSRREDDGRDKHRGRDREREKGRARERGREPDRESRRERESDDVNSTVVSDELRKDFEERDRELRKAAAERDRELEQAAVEADQEGKPEKYDEKSRDIWAKYDEKRDRIIARFEEKHDRDMDRRGPDRRGDEDGDEDKGGRRGDGKRRDRDLEPDSDLRPDARERPGTGDRSRTGDFPPDQRRDSLLKKLAGVEGEIAKEHDRHEDRMSQLRNTRDERADRGRDKGVKRAAAAMREENARHRKRLVELEARRGELMRAVERREETLRAAGAGRRD